MIELTHLEQVHHLAARGALFVINHSGGKDSQAMTVALRALIPTSQLLVIHADLPEVEWAGCWKHVQYSAAGLEVRQVRAGKTFFEMVERRQMWPSASCRQCTSDLKRGPINKEIRHYIKQTDHSGLVVNCMGIRAEESTNRAKAATFKYNERESKAGREWYDWLPIHRYTLADVWATLAGAGQRRHWAYDEGMERLSCCFCVLASKNDLQIAAGLVPELYARYVHTEQRIGHTIKAKNKKPYGLEEFTGIKAQVTIGA